MSKPDRLRDLQLRLDARKTAPRLEGRAAPIFRPEQFPATPKPKPERLHLRSAPAPGPQPPPQCAAQPAPQKPEPTARKRQTPARRPEPDIADLWSVVWLIGTWRADGKPGSNYWGTCSVLVERIGLTICELPLFYGLERLSMPSRPLLDVNGTRRVDEHGRAIYRQTVRFADKRAQAAFAEALRAELLRFHSELAGPPPAPPEQQQPA